MKTTRTGIETNVMETLKLTNETVIKAFDTWQYGDSKTFLSNITTGAKL